MGSGKKKDKKKKKRKQEDFNDDQENDAYQSLDDNKKYSSRDRDSYIVEDARSTKRSHKDRKEKDSRKRDRKSVPMTEEYVYDYSGQEMMHGTKESSKSPERKAGITPPPLPPGMDWPFEGSKTNNKSKSPLPLSENPEWMVQDEQNRDRDYQNEVDRKYREKQREEKRKQESNTAAASSTGNSESLSIEETNKLRAKLGLKPLELDSGSSKDENKEKSYADREDTHLPATNIGEKRSADKMREKMEAIREKRRINKAQKGERAW